MIVLVASREGNAHLYDAEPHGNVPNKEGGKEGRKVGRKVGRKEGR